MTTEMNTTLEEQTSKPNMEPVEWDKELKEVLQNKTESLDNDDDDEIRKQKIQMRIAQLNHKLEEMVAKYLNDNDERSIKNTITKHVELGHENVYINLKREDFTGWHTFVKGGYRNAHPRKCVHLFLRHAVKHDMLPKTIRWNIWNNQAFTVVFTFHKHKLPIEQENNCSV